MPVLFQPSFLEFSWLDLLVLRDGAHITRIEGVKALRLQNKSSLLTTLKIEVDQLVQHPAMQQSQDLGDSQTGCNRANEWRTNCFACQKGNSALVQIAIE